MFLSVACDVLDCARPVLAKPKALKALGVPAILCRELGLPRATPTPRSTSSTAFDVQQNRLLRTFREHMLAARPEIAKREKAHSEKGLRRWRCAACDRHRLNVRNKLCERAVVLLAVCLVKPHSAHCQGGGIRPGTAGIVPSSRHRPLRRPFATSFSSQPFGVGKRSLSPTKKAPWPAFAGVPARRRTGETMGLKFRKGVL